METLTIVSALSLFVIVLVFFFVFKRARKLEKQDTTFDLVSDDVYTNNLVKDLDDVKNQDPVVSEVIELGQQILDKLDADMAASKVVPPKKKTAAKKTAKKRTAKKKTTKKVKKPKNEKV